MKKQRIWEILEISKENDQQSKIFDYFISILIGLNVLAIILETEKRFFGEYETFFRYFEILSMIIFTIEYFLRFWSCTVEEDYRHPVIGRIKYFYSPMALIDFIAIVPFYLTFMIADARILRILRFLRVLKMTKHFHHSNTFHIITNTIFRKRSELISSLILMFSLLMICATGVFFAENETQPDKFSSIPSAMWWAVATLTTVGYGDIFPVTSMGKILGSISAIFGIGLFALPAGLLASGFSDEMQKEKMFCPHCGEKLQ